MLRPAHAQGQAKVAEPTPALTEAQKDLLSPADRVRLQEDLVTKWFKEKSSRTRRS